MTGNGLAQIALYFLVLTGLAVPLSAWMERRVKEKGFGMLVRGEDERSD